ncbi:MAG: hypothetical protein ACJ8F1_17825 [Polyangia bacterium]
MVLSERGSRTKVEIEIGTDAAEELAEYVRWIELSEGMPTAEARTATLEFALRRVFKADRLWQEHRTRAPRHDHVVAGAGPESAPPPLPPLRPAPGLPSPVSGK